jgi:KDO2-lipid IV(A) lauroyltransferase
MAELPVRKLFADYVVYLALRVVICLLQAMTIEACQRLSRALAVLACDVLRVRHNITDENLRHVYPDWSPAQRRDVARRMWEHLFLMVCEVAHVPRKIHETNWRLYIHVHRKRELVGYLLDPRPIVLVSGHFGNFEIASYSAGLLGFKTYAIARPLDNPFLDRYLKQFREAKGQYILPKDGSAAQVQQVLDSGGALALLGDQNAGPKGCWVEFLGRPASCHKALALFTLSGGAPMLVSYARRLDAPLSFEVGLQGVADPRAWDESLAGVKPLTQWYNAMLEALIRDCPDQYWWVHHRWKDEPRARKTAEKQAKKAA